MAGILLPHPQEGQLDLKGCGERKERKEVPWHTVSEEKAAPPPPFLLPRVDKKESSVRQSDGEPARMAPRVGVRKLASKDGSE